MQRPLPLTRDLVLIGGGHAHALVLKRWGMRPLPGARVTLINPAPTAPYTGMLPGHIAGHYQREALEIDLVRLCAWAGIRFVMGHATGIDRSARTVHVAGHPSIRFDIASLDVGITSDMPTLPGFAAHGVAAKPLGPYASAWASFCDAVVAGRRAPSVAVIGGGVAGIELALAMHHKLTGLGAAPEVTVIEAAAALSGITAASRARLLAHLKGVNIRLVERAHVDKVDADSIAVSGARRFPAAFTVGAAGARPHDWLSALDLAHEGGFLKVDTQLRSVSDTRIYAAGDCCTIVGHPVPKAGVYAVRAAPILYHNMRADLMGAQRRVFRPQRHYLKLISLGGKNALSDRGGITVSGPWLWRLKDRIDRDFMAKFTRLPPMPEPKAPRRRAKGVALDQAPCAGCGAKVGARALRHALAQRPDRVRTDLLSDLGDDAAVLRVGGATQIATLDHLRAFTEDPVTLARIAAIHAMGDCWAMGARPQAALASVILPHMADELAAATLREITETAAAVFAENGADLVGGHTSFGAEMTLGFAVTGLSDGDPVRLSGAQPGDALILTKALGTGVLLAAAMQARVAGPDIAAMQAGMAQSQGPAAVHLAGVAHAMTDVTGFGLAGHLLAMCEASQCGAILDLDTLPVYDGALGLTKAGVRSTLWHENAAAVANQFTAPPSAQCDLLFDPQTAGGLLAAIPADAVASVLDALRRTGLPTTRIGEMIAAPPRIRAQTSG